MNPSQMQMPTAKRKIIGSTLFANPSISRIMQMMFVSLLLQRTIFFDLESTPPIRIVPIVLKERRMIFTVPLAITAQS